MRLLWVTPDDRVPPAADVATLRQLAGLPVDVVAGAVLGLQDLKACQCEAVLAEFPAAGWTAEEWLEEVQRINPLLPVVIRHAEASLQDAVRLTKLGAYSVLEPGAPITDVALIVEEAIDYRHSCEQVVRGASPGQEAWTQLLVGGSQPMRNIAQTIGLVAGRRSTVLITGETGTGKEMVARAIHMASGRSHLPLVAINCNALPETLLEAELFGHVRGAFTGAINQRIGRFEQAHRSTLFLDEIGDMPLDLQSKLLRVLQEREFQRIGSSETLQVDVRVIAASNTDLVERIKQNKFREDLYYRLNVVPIRVPPLRERPEDIPLLVLHFIDKLCRQEDLPPKRISREALDRLAGYSWPGNVRQLENAVEMAIALSGDQETLYPGDFPLPAAPHWKTAPATAPMIRVPENGLDFERTVSRIERSILDQALERTNGNKKAAAEMLRLKRTTLSAKLKSLEAVAS